MRYHEGQGLAHKLQECYGVAGVTLVAVMLMLGVLALGCIIPSEPEYAPDAGVNAPPFVLWESADPPFENASLIGEDEPDFSVVVGDPDLDQELKVRFCFRSDNQAEAPFLLLQELVAGTGGSGDDPTLRVRVDPGELNLCHTFPVTPGSTHYLYVVVTDGSFRSSRVDECADVTQGSGSARAAWSFRCG